MERRRTESSRASGTTFGYVGRARAAPILARALRRLVGGGQRHVALLIPSRSGGSYSGIAGGPRLCYDWLVDAPADGCAGVLCVSAVPTAGGCDHSGLARRGHLSIVAVGSPGIVGSTPERWSRGSRPAAESLADRVEEHWVPPLQLSISRALTALTGAFHLIAMTTNEPGRIVCTGRGSTLCLGQSEEGVIVCSESSAVLSETGRVAFLHGGEIGVMDMDGWDLLAANAQARLRRPVVDLGLSREGIRRGVDAHLPYVTRATDRLRGADDEARFARGRG